MACIFAEAFLHTACQSTITFVITHRPTRVHSIPQAGKKKKKKKRQHSQSSGIAHYTKYYITVDANWQGTVSQKPTMHI